SALKQLDIRTTKIGRSDRYYDIFENLDTYIEKILLHCGLTAVDATLLSGDSGAAVKVQTPDRAVVVKISPFRGGMDSLLYFLSMLNGRGLPAPKVITSDGGRTLIPYDFIVME